MTKRPDPQLLAHLDIDPQHCSGWVHDTAWAKTPQGQQLAGQHLWTDADPDLFTRHLRRCYLCGTIEPTP